MAHPYKSYEENRHGRAVAKNRVKGYDSGGVVKLPFDSKSQHLNHMRGQQGLMSGRIEAREGNVVTGPGVSLRTGGTKPSVLRRWQEREEMPHAKGGRVKRQTGGPVGELEKAHRAMNIMADLRKTAMGGESAIPADKDEYYKCGGRIKPSIKRAMGGKITGGAESGVGRLQLAKRMARKY